MAEISFCSFDETKSDILLPQMFEILSTNMSKIAPTGNSYEEDKKIWLSYMEPNLKRKQIILMYVGEVLAGYFQYSLNESTVLIEEIEILPDYQRTLLFYRFLKYMSKIIPENIKYAEAYINKGNSNSQRIAQKLGLKIVGENPNGHSFRYRGEFASFKIYFAKSPFI